MYYPIQVPYVLSEAFSQHILYSEEVVDSLQDFVICIWEMKPRSSDVAVVTHVIVADGCIDLVVDYDNREVGFAGMSRTKFDDAILAPLRLCGVRMKPGEFEQLTGMPATAAMDSFVSLEAIDTNFDRDAFFEGSFDEVKERLKGCLQHLADGKQSNDFVNLFDALSQSLPSKTDEIYEMFHLSPRQCQRLFMKHFGFTPQMALSIVRFQHCLEILTSRQSKPSEVLEVTAYYDQSHFIKDFKRNIGLTPFEYLEKYKK